MGSFPFQLPIMESEDNLRSRQESGAIVRKPPIQEKEVHTTRHLIDLHRCPWRFESSRLDHLPDSVLHCFTPPLQRKQPSYAFHLHQPLSTCSSSDLK